MNLKKIVSIIVVVLVWAASFQVIIPAPARSASRPIPAHKVIMVVVDRITIDDLAAYAGPNLRSLLDNGASGLMNTNSALYRSPEGSYLTIGSGVVATAGPEGDLGFDHDETFEGTPAGDLYSRRMGSVISHESVVFLSMARLQKQNADLNMTVVPGALGGALRKNGLKTAVLGNADIPGGFRRQAVTIAMDDQGLVDLGHVGKTVESIDPVGLLPNRTNYRKILAELRGVLNRADFIVVELGDTARLDELADEATPDVVAKERKRVFADLDWFVGQVTASIDHKRSQVYLVTPSPSIPALKSKNTLTPVVVFGAGVKPGLITSPTTRRPGIITNTDIAPTILKFFGLEPSVFMTGRAVYAVPGTDRLSTLVEMNRRIVFTFLARPVLSKGYVILQIIIIILAMAIMFLRRRSAPNLEPFLLGLTAVPLSLLLIAGVAFHSLTGYVLAAVGVTVVLVAVSLRLGFDRGLDPFIFVCLGTTLALSIDVATGANLIKNSVLGYDPMSGARYYGIGNEYMGILIGAAIIGFTALLQRFPRQRKPLLILVAASFAAVIYLMAAPQLGTNVGGGIAALAGLGVTFLGLSGFRLTRREVLAAVLGILVVMVGFVAFDLSRPPEAQSHIGRTANMIVRGGVGEIGKIIARKSAMNLKLIRYTLWSRVFLISLLALAVLFYRPLGVLQRIKENYPYLTQGFIGVLVGSIVALIFNDSGVVAAATMMIYAAATLIYLVIRENTKEGIPETSELGVPGP